MKAYAVRLHGRRRDFVLIVTGKTSQRDIIRIAMSMIPEP